MATMLDVVDERKEKLDVKPKKIQKKRGRKPKQDIDEPLSKQPRRGTSPVQKESSLDNNDLVDFEFHYPFTLTMAGPTMSGKTYAAIRLLDEVFIDKFDHIAVMSLSMKMTNTWDKYEHHPKFRLFPNVTEDTLEDLVEEQVEAAVDAASLNRKMKGRAEYECESTLLVLDDVNDSGLLGNAGKLVAQAERGRHANMSIMVLSQVLTTISYKIRRQGRYAIAFNAIPGELYTFVRDYMAFYSKARIEKELKRIFKEEYRFIFAINGGPIQRVLHLGYSDIEEFLSSMKLHKVV